MAEGRELVVKADTLAAHWPERTVAMLPLPAPLAFRLPTPAVCPAPPASLTAGPDEAAVSPRHLPLRLGETIMETATERNVLDCPKCGKRAESNGEPVTVSGWYGDVRYGWGQYAGVHMCRAVRAQCPECKIEWSAEPDWD